MKSIWQAAVTGNFQPGRRNPITRITYHHIVGDAMAAINRFKKPGEEVSATYVIGSDGTLYQCVREEDTPYTDANSDSNSRSITIEHAGGLPTVPYTEAMYRTSIQLTRELIQKYGITDFKRHRDVSNVPTACPGALDVERIVKEAKGENMPLAPEDEYLKKLGLAVQRTKSWPAINSSKDQNVVIQNVVDVFNSLEDYKAKTLKEMDQLRLQIANLTKDLEQTNRPQSLKPGVYEVK